MWARNAGILFFGQNLLFFTIFWTKFKIEKIFIFFDQFCSPPIFSHICVGDFMQNFRTVGLRIKKVRDLFILSDEYGKIIRCENLSFIAIKGGQPFLFCFPFNIFVLNIKILRANSLNHFLSKSLPCCRKEEAFLN